jgi:hypothetical protein
MAAPSTSQRLGDEAVQTEAGASRYERFGAAASRWTVRSCAPCEVTGKLKDSARWQIFMNAVTPPQLVTSGSGKRDPAS